MPPTFTQWSSKEAVMGCECHLATGPQSVTTRPRGLATSPQGSVTKLQGPDTKQPACYKTIRP